MYVTLRSSTCFEQHAAHHQEDQLYHHSLWYRHSSQTAVQYAGGERTAVRSPAAYSTVAYRGWRYQRLWWYNLSSWWWAACCSKHVQECNVTYILLNIKRIVHKHKDVLCTYLCHEGVRSSGGKVPAILKLSTVCRCELGFMSGSLIRVTFWIAGWEGWGIGMGAFGLRESNHWSSVF